MQRIFLFIDSLGAGGAQRQLTGLAVLLKEKGYAVKVVTYYPFDFYKHVLSEHDIENKCLNIDSKLCLPQLVKEIRRFDADVIVSFQTIPNILAVMAAKITRTKLIVSERNTHQKLSAIDKLAFKLYRWADVVVPNSYSEETFIKTRFPYLTDKTVAVTNFVDLKRFVPMSAAKSATSEKRILVVATVSKSKNTLNFIRAFHLARKHGMNARVVWYGVSRPETGLQQNVDYAKECQKLVDGFGMNDVFCLEPKRKDIENAYREADIFCLPSLFEGTPNVICEAMACELPVMASKVCDNAIYVRPGCNGWLFKPDDIDGMAGVLLEACSSDDLSQYGCNSRKRVKELCSEDVFVNKWIKIIDRL